MNNISFNFTYIFITLAIYLPSAWTKFAWSGANYTEGRFATVAFYNMLCMAFHWDFIDTGHIPFFEPQSTSAVRWLSLLMILAYALTFPTEKENKLFPSTKHSTLRFSDDRKRLKFNSPYRHITQFIPSPLALLLCFSFTLEIILLFLPLLPKDPYLLIGIGVLVFLTLSVLVS